MGNNRNAKRVYAVDCLGNCLAGQLKKRWRDSVKACLKKRKRKKKDLNVRQGRRMVYDRDES